MFSTEQSLLARWYFDLPQSLPLFHLFIFHYTPIPSYMSFSFCSTSSVSGAFLTENMLKDGETDKKGGWDRERGGGEDGGRSVISELLV